MHKVRPHRSARSTLLAERAFAMRECPTASEEKLWRLALCRRGLGVPFRRQVVLGERVIVDFFAPKQKLAVEIDGPYHAGRRAADARRDRRLARLGCRVLRLDAALVLNDLPAAVALIRAALGSGAER